MFRTAFQQYCFQNALGLHPSICLNLNEETILKRQRTPTVYTITVSPASVHLNASPASAQKNLPPTVYCLNCGCQRNKQMLLGNDCCSTHTVGTSQKKRKQLFHIHQIPWRTPPSKRHRLPLSPASRDKKHEQSFLHLCRRIVCLPFIWK
jgi:hypothetical protein